MNKIHANTDSGAKVEEKIWKNALAAATLDETAGIRHAAISGDPALRLHVAEILDRVNCHVHLEGNENYQIIQGEAVLHYGGGEFFNGIFKFSEKNELKVSSCDCFVIPPGCAHQLVRSGSEKLIILFSCPDSHLSHDRYLLPDLCPEKIPSRENHDEK